MLAHHPQPLEPLNLPAAPKLQELQRGALATGSGQSPPLIHEVSWTCPHPPLRHHVGCRVQDTGSVALRALNGEGHSGGAKR